MSDLNEIIDRKNTLVTIPGPYKATGDAANLAEEPGSSSVYVQPNYNNVNDDDLFYVHYQKQVWPQMQFFCSLLPGKTPSIC